jgi:hypothetical protein
MGLGEGAMTETNWSFLDARRSAPSGPYVRLLHFAEHPISRRHDTAAGMTLRSSAASRSSTLPR